MERKEYIITYKAISWDIINYICTQNPKSAISNFFVILVWKMLRFLLLRVFNAIIKTICLKAHTFQEQHNFVGPQIHLPYSLDNMC